MPTCSGLRQSDPLSPACFAMVVSVFALIPRPLSSEAVGHKAMGIRITSAPSELRGIPAFGVATGPCAATVCCLKVLLPFCSLAAAHPGTATIKCIVRRQWCRLFAAGLRRSGGPFCCCPSSCTAAVRRSIWAGWRLLEVRWRCLLFYTSAVNHMRLPVCFPGSSPALPISIPSNAVPLQCPCPPPPPKGPFRCFFPLKHTRNQAPSVGSRELLLARLLFGGHHDHQLLQMSGPMLAQVVLQLPRHAPLPQRQPEKAGHCVDLLLSLRHVCSRRRLSGGAWKAVPDHGPWTMETRRSGSGVSRKVRAERPQKRDGRLWGLGVPQHDPVLRPAV